MSKMGDVLSEEKFPPLLFERIAVEDGENLN
jgi:hypothetical protein